MTILNFILVGMYFFSLPTSTILTCVFLMSFPLGLQTFLNIIEMLTIKNTKRMVLGSIDIPDKKKRLLNLSHMVVYQQTKSFQYKLLLVSQLFVCALCLHLGCWWPVTFLIISVICKVLSFNSAIDNILFLEKECKTE